VALQVISAIFLPRTNGFSNLGWTFLVLISIFAAFWCISQLLRQGAALSIISPLMAASVPFIIIILARLSLGETASLLKLSLLALSCVIVGAASSLR
jgi:quaternary ammonium compound-resistance protein SugE